MVVAPYAGHSSTIAGFQNGQSLVETLLDHGLGRLCVTDWKSAAEATKSYDIDNYLAALNVCVDDLGGSVNLIGLCQGGWLSAMYAARFPAKVRTLVLAGAPIDTDAGEGPVKDYAHTLPTAFYERLVKLGGGMLRGDYMLTGFKSMHPDTQYVAKFHNFYRNIDNPEHRRRFEEFERWYEYTVDLPGVWYLQVITQLFKQNRLAKGEFVGLGRQLTLKDVTCPVYLLAGEADDVTPREQVFNAENYLGTPRSRIIKEITPGGHIGLFMGKETLAAKWSSIAAWIQRAG
jgi:poly(3-hydroxyalkanoate) synthetase